MNKNEYAEYLGTLIAEDIDSENEEFYAYFQCFMPCGDGVEKVFKPLEKGEALLDRIMPIYQVTEEKTIQQFESNLVPGYFCPNPVANHLVLKDLGEKHVESLKIYAEFYKDNELYDLLNNITEISILDSEAESKNDEINAFLYDSISEWGIDNEDNESLISVLSEAYYSINCDYYLSYYLQYPVFKNKPKTDFLKSYFDIWKSGYSCKFDEKRLMIYK